MDVGLKRSLIGLLLTLSVSTRFTIGNNSEAVSSVDYTDAIHQLYSEQFPVQKAKTPEELQKEAIEKSKRILRSLVKPIKLEPFLFSELEMKKVAHDIIHREYKKSSANNSQAIIGLPSVKKLNLIMGSASDLGHSLANVMGQNFKSVLAKEELIYQLTQPTSDVELLHTRQELVKYFTTDSAKQLKKSLDAISSLEKSVLSFWHTGAIVDEFYVQTAYWNKLFFLFDVSSLNKYPIALEFNRITQVIEAAGMLYAAYKIAPYVSREVIQEYINAFKTYYSESSIKFKVGVPLAALYGSFSIFAGQMFNYNQEKAFCNAQKHLIDLASYINEIELCVAFAQDNTVLLQLLPDIQHLIDINDCTKHTEKFNKLIALLKTSTFTGNASYFSYLGRVKVAYKLMLEVRQEFEPILRAVAQLQVYNGLAQLLQNYQNNGNKFCFAEFVEHGPSIEAIDFWNPLVEQGTAVSNSLNLGHMKNLVLHGPNTGGKTTTIKGLMEAIILAQTLGIAPARSLQISLFAQLNCFMDIQDDIAAGTSLFKAEVLQAKSIIDRIRSLKENEYVFTIADEVLRSTTPTEGEHASCMFARKIGKMKNSACIIVSHYPKVAQLSEEAHTTFTTKHVEIIRNPDGSITRTFKLKDGSTNENIAMDILKDVGVFDASDFD